MIESHHSPRFLIKLNIEVLIEFCYLVLLRPLFCITELRISAVDVKLSCTEVASTPLALSDKRIGSVLTELFDHYDLRVVLE